MGGRDRDLELLIPVSGGGGGGSGGPGPGDDDADRTASSSASAALSSSGREVRLSRVPLRLPLVPLGLSLPTSCSLYSVVRLIWISNHCAFCIGMTSLATPVYCRIVESPWLSGKQVRDSSLC